MVSSAWNQFQCPPPRQLQERDQGTLARVTTVKFGHRGILGVSGGGGLGESGSRTGKTLLYLTSPASHAPGMSGGKSKLLPRSRCRAS